MDYIEPTPASPCVIAVEEDYLDPWDSNRDEIRYHIYGPFHIDMAAELWAEEYFKDNYHVNWSIKSAEHYTFGEMTPPPPIE